MNTLLYINTSLQLSDLLKSVPGGIAQGIIWGIMALGLYITFRILNFSDLTVDGSFTTGGAVTVMLILSGVNPWLSVVIAMLAGLLTGICTGLLHTRLGIPAILSGILTQFALFSINLAIMGFSANKAIAVGKYALSITSRSIQPSILIGLIAASAIIAVLYWYFGTRIGSAIRAAGSNPDMAKAQGINIDTMKIFGLALSNALVALSGGLMAQFQGFADVNMGRGAIVIGLAAVIIGEVFCDIFFRKNRNFAVNLSFVVIGGMIYYLVVVVVLWLKLNSNMLRLFTAIIVALFLAIPHFRTTAANSFAKAGKLSKLRMQKEEVK